jgi:2-C-methyl-D-erythritol 4-phosphate cytidylyltransferase
MNIAIICAGGNGERMKTKENKIFLKLNGRPIIYYTLRTFAAYREIDSIIVTTGTENIDRLRELIEQSAIEKVVSIEYAFETRQESTYHIIEKLKALNIPRDSYLLIHNAVNPFVTHAELDRCLEGAHQFGASLLAFPASDTVKIVNSDNIIDRTPMRESLWIAQTPQIIRFDLALDAFEHAQSAGFFATDDSTLVESIQGKVQCIECSRENFKITYPHDLELARQIYTRRMRENNSWYE